MTKFKAIINLGPNLETQNVFAEFEKDEFNLSYDDVIDELYSKIEEKYPAEFYPKAEITDIFILKHENDENHEYPVIAESQSRDKYLNDFEKILVLPENRYTLTPEMKLYMNMVKRGIIDEDHEFDFDEMHELINDLNLNEKENDK